jgi:hypothetical protein
MKAAKQIQLLSFQTITDADVQHEWTDPTLLRQAEWGEGSTVTLNAKIVLLNSKDCSLNTYRAGILWRCEHTNRGGVAWTRVTTEDLLNGVQLELIIDGSEAEREVSLRTLILADGGSGEKLKPKWSGSILWEQDDKLMLGERWGFPVACGEYTKGKYARVPWFLDVPDGCLNANVHSGPLLIINLAHAEGRALQDAGIARPDLIKRVAIDVLRGLLLGLILNYEEEELAEDDSGSTLGKVLGSWLCSVSGKQSVGAFVDQLKRSPSELDRLIISYFDEVTK